MLQCRCWPGGFGGGPECPERHQPSPESASATGQPVESFAWCCFCSNPERREKVDAAMASTTRIAVAEIPCPGALASRFDAAQGFSSGGRHFMYVYCDFASRRVSHSAKKRVHFRSNFRDRPICAEKKSRPEIGHPFSDSSCIFKCPPS